MIRLRLFSRVHSGKLPRATSLQVQAFMSGLPDCEIELQIKRLPQASDPQRKYWFGVIIPAVMSHCGYPPTEKEAAHADLLLHLMPEYQQERINRIQGSVEPVRVSWTDLSRHEASELIERAFVWASTTLGLVIPSPEEHHEQ